MTENNETVQSKSGEDCLWKCQHPRQEKRRRTLVNGVTTVVMQCLDCGSQVRSLPKAGEIISKLPEFDHAIKETQRSLMTEEWEKKRAEESARFWENYEAYLNSWHWKRVRQIVLERDPMCQVCFSLPSQQAHHLTYESFKRYGISFAVECVGVCVECHENKLHGGNNG